ncbi:MAG: hypothetical protein J2P19_33505 [Pseudonocardia sp.]|nr:hypothetical protein [Pseudonocardia sp.]
MPDPVASLRREIKKINERLEALELHVTGRPRTGLAEEVRRLEAVLDEVASEIDDVGYAVDGLADRIRLLERRFRGCSTIEVADLDDWPAECATEAEAIGAGQEARKDLLDADRRDRWQALIGQPDELRAAMRVQRAAALTAARAATELDHADADGWRRTVAMWNGAVTVGKDAEAALPSAQAEAATARAELAAATTLDEQARPRVRRADEARTALLATIRARIDAAVRDDLLFPSWFETALGPGAPSANTGSWLDTAVDVVAYRLVNHVDDQVLALGERPSDEGWRREEFDRLSNACRGGRV